MSKEEAIHEIQKKVGNQFDPAVVAALVKVHQKPAFDVVINDYPDESETRNTAERLERPSVGEEMGIRSYPRAVGSTVGGVGFEG
jgi:HD-GYP domain-containing protein (c-di-GMP phosphodiesterase class II)